MAISHKSKTATGHKVVTFASGTEARAASPSCVVAQSLDDGDEKQRRRAIPSFDDDDDDDQWGAYMVPPTPTADARVEFVGLDARKLEHASDAARDGNDFAPLCALLRSDNEACVAQAAMALRCWARKDKKLDIARAGAIPPLCAIVTKTDRGAGCRAQAAGCLRNLSVDARCRARIGKEHDLTLALAELVAKGATPAAREHAAGALRNLSVLPAARDRIAAVALKPLAALVLDGDDKGRAQAALCLGNLAKDDYVEARIGRVPWLLEALVRLTNEDDGELATAALSALWNLTVSAKNKATVAACPGVFRRVLDALREDHDWAKKEAAAGVLCNITIDAAIAGDFAAVEGAVEAVFDLALSCTDRCKEQLVGVLRNVTAVDAARAAIATILGLKPTAAEHVVDAALLDFRRGSWDAPVETFGVGFKPAYARRHGTRRSVHEDDKAMYNLLSA